MCRIKNYIAINANPLSYLDTKNCDNTSQNHSLSREIGRTREQEKSARPYTSHPMVTQGAVKCLLAVHLVKLSTQR